MNSPTGSSSSNESANKLFVEATTLFQESFDQESSDPEAAAVASEKALNEIEKITRSYPSSDLAVKFVQGQPIFNELSVKALHERQKELQATAKVVQDATKSPQDFAVWLAGHNPQLAYRYFVEIGDTKQALQVANIISDDLLKTSASRGVATALTEKGDTKQALQVANTIQEDFKKARALVDIATALAKAGDTKQAQTVFKRALEVANAISDYVGKLSALRSIAAALVKAGYTTQALQVANNLQKDSGKAWVFWEIAGALAEAGDTTQALQVCNTIQEGFSKAWALSNTAIALVKAGDNTQAQTVLKQSLQVTNAIQEDSPKAFQLERITQQIESLLLFETSSNGQQIPIREFSKEQRQLARMSIVTYFIAEHLMTKVFARD